MRLNVSARLPDADLRSSVQCYQWFEFDNASPIVVPVPPVASCDVVFQHGEPFARRHRFVPIFPAYPRAFVVTPSRIAADVRVPARARAFRAVLQPYVVRALFNQRAVTVSNRMYELAHQPFDRGLAASMTSTADFDEAIIVFEQGLRACLPASNRDAEQMAQIVRLVAEGTRVSEVAAIIGISERQITRRFLETVGLRPKFFQRISRLNAVIAQLRGDQQPNWADLAAANGFSDHAHLVREFVALTGRSPRQFLPDAWFARLLLQRGAESVPASRTYRPSELAPANILRLPVSAG